VFSALLPLALGHLLAIAAVLLPASLLLLYVWHFAALKLVAGLALAAIGIYRLLNLGRHSRFLARIGPRHLVLWSFLMATSHGAGLMLAPVVLDLCQSDGGMGLMVHFPGAAGGSLEIASLATLLHSMAMIATAGLTAWLVYRWLGLTILRKSWFNMDFLGLAIDLCRRGGGGSLVPDTAPDMDERSRMLSRRDRAPCCLRVIEPACVLRKALQALNAFFCTLDEYTIADLLEPSRSLARLSALSRQ
jgi:hypothetical protein